MNEGLSLGGFSPQVTRGTSSCPTSTFLCLYNSLGVSVQKVCRFTGGSFAEGVSLHRRLCAEGMSLRDRWQSAFTTCHLASFSFTCTSISFKASPRPLGRLTEAGHAKSCAVNRCQQVVLAMSRSNWPLRQLSSPHLPPTSTISYSDAQA